MRETGSTVDLMGVEIDALSGAAVVARVREGWRAGHGGTIVPANLDQLRLLHERPELAAIHEAADLVVADGTPLLWAARLQRTPLPERVAGSDLVWSLAAAAAAEGVGLFLLGGAPGAAAGAAAELERRHPGLQIAGTHSPPFGFEEDPAQLAAIERQVLASGAGLVFVALGFPKQERLIARLAPLLPSAWFLACGISLSFIAGEVARAPRWMQRLGLEWVHRLGQEPGRLAERYLVHDLPFAARLFAASLRRRGAPPPARRRGSRPGALTRVEHFGPDPAEIGGISSVIRVLVENRVGGEEVHATPTWRPGGGPSRHWLAARAIPRLLALEPGQVAHFHLSEKGSFLREGGLLALARRRHLVTAITIHGATFLPFAARRPRLVAAVLGQADLITCLDREVLATVRRLAPEVESALLPNPVPIDRAAPPADQTEELVLFAGEIGRRKGADVLAAAWEEVAASRPAARCLLAGPPGDFTVPPLERLTVRGPVDPAEVRELLHRARVVTLPSRAEGMPMVLTEAMGSARGFVSTTVGGIPELAEGGVLVEPGDASALAARLTELLADPARALELGRRGLAFCERTRGVAVIDRELRRLYAAAAAQEALPMSPLPGSPDGGGPQRPRR